MNNFENMPHILIYTDGSCHRNPGPGGYAATLRRIDADGVELKVHRVKGHEPGETTNNRMEMTAVARALDHLKADEPQPIIIRTDSDIIVRSMTEWLPSQIARGWRKSDGKPVENRDLWERILAGVGNRQVSWQWVKGHAGDPRNEEVDQLAKAQCKIAQKKAIDRMFPD